MTQNTDPERDQQQRQIELPMTSIYEQGMKFGTSKCRVEVNGEAWENIDWDAPITTSTEMQQATTRGATQFQYANTAHLILCGKILKHEVKHTSMDAQKLAVTLSAHKVEAADIWGQYLQKTKTGYGINPEMTAYYRQLFSETEALPLFIGLETLGGPVIRTIYETVQDTGDPVFQQITKNLLAQKEQELDIAKTFLSPMVAADTETAQSSIEQYRDLAEKLLFAHQDDLNALDINVLELRNKILDTVDEFQEDLGIT